MNILEIMKSRHSVRSFDGNPLSDADKKSLMDTAFHLSSYSTYGVTGF